MPSRFTPPPNTTVPHGTTSMYGYGCRCADCAAAMAAYRRERRAQGEKRDDGHASKRRRRLPGAILPRPQHVARQHWWQDRP